MIRDPFHSRLSMYFLELGSTGIPSRLLKNSLSLDGRGWGWYSRGQCITPWFFELLFISPHPVIPAGAQENHLRPFGGVNVHWTFTTTPSHLPQGEREPCERLFSNLLVWCPVNNFTYVRHSANSLLLPL